jgi:hypothetical protein
LSNVNGIIAQDGNIVRVNLLSSLLVMDTDAYAANLMKHLEVLACDDDNAGDFDMALYIPCLIWRRVRY